ncbi:hypothetical protein RU639_013145 [Aspergillus parasiticus]|uniref:MADS-box domain-containing protein n=1 Tax=Aspergillus transmontanensis TaxID=1034304 RepID=A0A5N6VJ59_9EURO|nr:hypothetical protein BDV41DRAFT_551357 [Aspergillus transmontanensis]
MGGPDPGRHERKTFRKRSGTLLGKAHELAALSGANVYVIIDHPRATVEYNSVGNRNWLPSDENLESIYPSLQRLSFADMEKARGNSNGEELTQLLQYIEYRSELLQSLGQQMQEGQSSPTAGTPNHIPERNSDRFCDK